jgi:hypothetical protein
MALNGDALGLAIKVAVDAVENKSDREALFKAIGNAIITYITANATVTIPGLTLGPSSGIGTPPSGGIS